MDITCVTIDCHDPGKAAKFWNQALAWGGVVVSPDGSGAACGPATRGQPRPRRSHQGSDQA
ncbi:MAG: VOC family protein [Acidimicrobiales bacterium]